MDWTTKKVLVTGAGGFIGSHLTEKLLELGADVRAFVRYSSKNTAGFLDNFTPEQKANLEIIKGDIVDLTTVQEAAKGMDIIFHLAASISVQYSFERPYEVIRTNTMGTLNILQAAKEAKVERVVITSSSETYGTAMYTPIDEVHPLQTQSPYAASKAAGDKIAESYFRTYGLPVVTLRPFNTFGPRQSMRAVLPTIIVQALTQDKIHLGNLSPRRDWTFVLDTVQGFIKAAESDKTVGKTMNIGMGKDYSIEEAAKIVLRLLNKDMPITSDEVRKRSDSAEVKQLLAGNELAFMYMGWKPENTFEEGLQKTIDWIKGNLHEFQTKEEYLR